MSDTDVLRRCPRCHVKLIDDAIECPLCRGVVDADEDRNMEEASMSVTYPDISYSIRTIRLIIRIVLFCALTTEVTALIVNYFTFNGIYWSLIVGAGLLYGCATLLHSVKERKSMQRIIQVQLYFSLILVFAIDYLLGFKGWSLSYAFPIALVGVDIAMVVLMIVRIDGWQSFIMTEIVIFVFSIILFVLNMMGKINGFIFSLMATVITGLILVGTIMFGQKMVSNEIKRRFMI